MKNVVLNRLKRKIRVWVLICTGFFLFKMDASAAPARPQGYVMQIQLTPAVCALDSSKQKQRKCLEGYSLTITGLLPETTQKDCQTSSSATLTPLQSKVVARVMPDQNARTQLWASVGGCVPMNASQYFRTMINLAEKLKIPADLTSADSRVVYHNQLKAQFTKLNPSLPSNSLNFICQSSRSSTILTEIEVCYKVNGQYKQCSSQLVSNCPNSFSIKGAY
ncbi:ribonuclease I [Acinetobacter piscicola]|uniref:Ribonuclease I n=1 Tax=Acinetobacter piscicola TaxID=2006115 RepID=A0A4V1W170_9GAMM|nr:ribonuclease I [Acinetobacter sp. 256-1]MDM1760962.1 ribonuclease I [Acinetobacter sp. 251-1]QOW44944.1 ribonuclease I [Acinetobacter piscicola]RYL25659.1 ribonuclease I [Acinetobacter piscicola]